MITPETAKKLVKALRALVSDSEFQHWLVVYERRFQHYYRIRAAIKQAEEELRDAQ